MYMVAWYEIKFCNKSSYSRCHFVFAMSVAITNESVLCNTYIEILRDEYHSGRVSICMFKT